MSFRLFIANNRGHAEVAAVHRGGGCWHLILRGESDGSRKALTLDTDWVYLPLAGDRLELTQAPHDRYKDFAVVAKVNGVDVSSL